MLLFIIYHSLSKHKIFGFISSLVDVILPAICVNCGAEVSGSGLLCPRCLKSIIIRKAPRKIGSRFLFAAADYGDPAVRNLVKAMKYSGIWKAGLPLVDIIGKHLEISGFMQTIPDKDKSFIIPVPIHFLKKWRRGFNQSEIMANIMGKKLGVPAVRALKRRRWTPPQSGMAGDKTRSLNVKGCFSLSRRAAAIPRKSALIILDDVVTSGGTIKEAARALRPLHPYQIIFVSAASR